MYRPSTDSFRNTPVLSSILRENGTSLRSRQRSFAEAGCENPAGRRICDAGTEEIRRVLEICRLDMVQLHGQETDEEIRRLREEYKGRSELCIVKAFRIENEEDVRKAENSAADEILLDHGAGGTGESFDWSLLKNCRRRFFLAGGLTPDNVQLAIEEAKPYAVDVSSSLETDGRKDPCKIRRFVTAVRGADEK